MTDEEQIKEIYRQHWRDLIAKNTDSIRPTMTKDYYLQHMTGDIMNREEFLQALLDGTLNYYSADHDSIDVNVNGNKATMRGRSRVNAAVYGGGRYTWRLQQNFTLEKVNGKWMLTSSKASTY